MDLSPPESLDSLFDSYFEDSSSSIMGFPAPAFPTNHPIPSNTSEIEALLSASHYPVLPDRVQREPWQSTTVAPSQLLPDLFSHVQQDKTSLDTTSSNVTLSTPSEHPEQSLPSSIDLPKTRHSTRKKVGRPRKVIEDAATQDDTNERRRKQLRVAQRMYRMRKDLHATFLQDRVAQLESSVDRMSSAIISFSEALIQSKVLSPNRDLTEQLGSVIQTCLASVKESSSEPTVEEPLHSHGSRDRFIPYELPPSFIPPDFSTLNAGDSPWKLKNMASSTSYISYTEFMDKLHISILYYGYLALANPSTPLETVRRHFRLMLSVMDRKRTTSFFAAAFHAKISRQTGSKESWKDVPYFQLGGAGTHFSESPGGEKLYTSNFNYRSHQWRVVPVSSSNMATELHDDLDGDWFDMQDLEIFLRKQKINLLLRSATSPGKEAYLADTVNVQAFIGGLLKKSLCLGRCAGFRRRDVEAAMQTAMRTGTCR